MIEVLRNPITRAQLRQIAEDSSMELVKAVVDVERGVMAIGGELHSDEESILLDEGSHQRDLWGINLYPLFEKDSMIEFDSMINIRPSHGNRSRTVEDKGLKQRIHDVVHYLIKG